MEFISTEYESPLGTLTLASDGEALCGLWLSGQKRFGESVPAPLRRDDAAKAFNAVRAWLDDYFAGAAPSSAELPLAPRGSEFRQAVWRILLEIPYGETITYGAIAQRLKTERGKASARAVGGAVGSNPVSIVIPCHRVVGAGGNLTGYAGGIERKVWLLKHEGVDVRRFHIPKRGTAL